MARCTAALSHGLVAHGFSMTARFGHLVAVSPGVGASFVHDGATCGVLFVVIFGHGGLNGVVDVGSSIQSGSLGVGSC